MWYYAGEGVLSMNLTLPYTSRKYLIRLLLSMTLLLLVLLSASSAALYIHTERTVLDIQQSASEKMLAQTIYNLDSVNELVKTTAISAYYDSDVSDFMYADLQDTYTLYQHLSTLERLMKAAPFLHSIVIYNERNQCYYSYSPSAILACQPEGVNMLTARYVANQTNIPKLKLLPVSASTHSVDRRPIDFFSYFMYSDKPTSLNKKGMLILNVQPEWVFAQLSGINRLKDNGNSRLLLMNGSGERYDPVQQSWSDGGELYQSLQQEMNGSENSADLFVHGTGKEKEIVSYMKSSKYDWTVVSVQPYEQVFHEILQMRAVSFYIIAVFLLLALGASAALALRLYHPVEILLRKVRSTMTAATTDSSVARKDEWAYLSNAFQHTIDQVHQLAQHQDDQNRVLRSYDLKKIVLESASTPLEDIQEMIRQHRLALQLEHPFLLVGFRIDDFKPQANSSGRNQDSAAYPAVVCTLASEMLSDRYVHECMDMGNGCVLVVLAWPEETRDSDDLLQRIRSIQGKAGHLYSLSLTAAVSPIGEHMQQLSRLYEQVLDYINYRMLFGRMALITPELVEPNMRSGQFLSSPELEKRLSEGLKSGRIELVIGCLEEWFCSLRLLKYEQMLYGMFHLLATIHKYVEEMNGNRLQPVALDTRELYGQLAHIDTLQEAEQLFHDKLAEIIVTLNEPTGDHTNQLVSQTIHEIIHTRYMDANLCLPEIASMIRLSSAHISKLFKQKYGAGIPEYLNEVRLQQAITLLSQHEYSVNQIMERVGFTNQSYFFRLFKKRYGTTPKEYRLKQVL